eukprot:gene15203-32210_t
MQKFVRNAVMVFFKNQALKRLQKSLYQLNEDSSNRKYRGISSEDPSSEMWPSEAAHISARVVSSIVLNTSRFFHNVDHANVLDQLRVMLRDKAVDFYTGCSHYKDSQIQDVFEKELKAVLEHVVVMFLNDRLRRQDGGSPDYFPFEGRTNFSDNNFLNHVYGGMSFDLDLLNMLSGPSPVAYEKEVGEYVGSGRELGDSWSDSYADVSFDM